MGAQPNGIGPCLRSKFLEVRVLSPLPLDIFKKKCYNIFVRKNKYQFFFFITSFRSPLSGELVAKNTPSRGATEFGRMYSTNTVPQSSGQDMRFSFSKPGFNSPRDHHIIRSGAEVAYLAHNQRVAGSNPASGPTGRESRYIQVLYIGLVVKLGERL